MEKFNSSVFIDPYDPSKDILFLLDKPETSDIPYGKYTPENYTIIQNLLKELPTEIQSNITIGFISPYPSKEIKDQLDNKLGYSLFKQYFEKKLLSSKHKIIIVFGSVVAYSLGFEKPITELRSIKDTYNGSEVHFTYSHPYLKVQGADSVGKKYFDQCLNDIKSALGIISKQDDLNNLKYDFLDYTNVNKLFEIFKNDKEIVFDYEASGLDIKMPYFYVGSCGFYGLQTKKSAYLSIYSLERLWTSENKSLQTKIIYDALNKFFSDKSKLFICFNCAYEYLVTAIHYGVKFNQLADVYEIARCLGYSGSLKDQASSKLEIVKWNDQVAEWMDKIDVFMKQLNKYLTSKKKDPIIQQNILDCLSKPESTIQDLIQCNQDFSDKLLPIKYLIDSFYDNTEKGKSDTLKTNKDTVKLFDYLYKTKTEVNFTHLPEVILGNYCVFDVINTGKLYELYLDECKKLDIPKSTINLFYRQGLLACEMNLNGTNWDNDQAKKQGEFYYNLSLSNLKMLLLDDIFKKNLFNKYYNDELEKSIEEYKGDLFNYNYTHNENDLPSDFKKPKLKTEWTTTELLDIQTCTDVSKLKEYYNPNSNLKSTVKVFSDSIMSYEVKACRIFQDYSVISESNKDNKDFINTKYPTINKYFSEYNSIEELSVVKVLSDKYDLINTLINEKRYGVEFSNVELFKDKKFSEFYKDKPTESGKEENKRILINTLFHYERELEIAYGTELQSRAKNILNNFLTYISDANKSGKYKSIFTTEERSLIFKYLSRDYIIDGLKSEELVSIYKAFQDYLKVDHLECADSIESDEDEDKRLLDENNRDLENTDKYIKSDSDNSELTGADFEDNEIEKNIDKKLTWTHEFKILIYMRTFKKAIKIYTSYIEGKCGYDQVIVCDKDEVKTPIYRAKRKYIIGEELKDDECLMKNYQFHPNTCFTEDTEILMVNNYKKKIKDIEIGDKVISYNEIKNIFEEDEVINQQLTNKIATVIELEFENGDKIKCTPDHKFLTKNRGWVEAGLLTSYDDIVEYVN